MAVAVGLVVLIVARLDQKIFSRSVANGEQVKKRAEDLIASMQNDRQTLKKAHQPVDYSQYVLTDSAMSAANSATNDVALKDSLRVTGLMRISGGVLAAVINGSVVHKGDRVLGCDVLEISETGVSVNVSGKTVNIPIHGEYTFEKVKTNELVLNRIDMVEGRNVAVINGLSYKVGDWIDGYTKVKAITPSSVLLDKGGATVSLRMETPAK
jgi:hypothetical protein